MGGILSEVSNHWCHLTQTQPNLRTWNLLEAQKIYRTAVHHDLTYREAMISVGSDQLIAYHKAFSWMFDRVSFGSILHCCIQCLKLYFGQTKSLLVKYSMMFFFFFKFIIFSYIPMNHPNIYPILCFFLLIFKIAFSKKP